MSEKKYRFICEASKENPDWLAAWWDGELIVGFEEAKLGVNWVQLVRKRLEERGVILEDD